jgi:hypothetical protein
VVVGDDEESAGQHCPAHLKGEQSRAGINAGMFAYSYATEDVEDGSLEQLASALKSLRRRNEIVTYGLFKLKLIFALEAFLIPFDCGHSVSLP